LDTVFLRFRGFMGDLVAPLFGFELKKNSWYGKRDLIELTLHTALLNSYAEGVAETLREHKRMPTSETLLDYVKAMTVDDVMEVAEIQIGRCVQALKKKGMTIKRAAVAFDWHDRPYYGSPAIEGVVGVKPKRGTSYAFSFLTASVITPGRRLVLCLLPLTGRKDLPRLVLGLLEQIRRYVKKIAYVAFDNGFQDKELLKELLSRGTPFILPLRKTAKLKKRWRWMRYASRFNYRTRGVEVDVVKATDAKGWRYFLATNLAATPRKILKLYKRRWGVETSYRKIGEFLPKTTSRSHVIRVFYFALAILLYNVWVVLNAHAGKIIKVIRLKLSCLWSLLSNIVSIEENLPAG